LQQLLIDISMHIDISMQAAHSVRAAAPAWLGCVFTATGVQEEQANRRRTTTALQLHPFASIAQKVGLFFYLLSKGSVLNLVKVCLHFQVC
jgi:hypothetical protein